MKINKKYLLVIGLLVIAVVLTILLVNTSNTSPLHASSSFKFVDSFKVRPLTDIKYERTAQRLKQGKYLTEGILMCFTCHSPRNQDIAGAPLYDDRKGSGGTIVYLDSANRIIAPNITPDIETGAGTWTDDMFARAIREGVGHDGRALAWQMPHFSFRDISDDDLASVIAYVRSLPAIHNVVPRTIIPAEERSMIEKSLQPITAPISAPDVSDPVKRGAYLVKIGECVGCHTSHSEYNPGLFGGGNLVVRYQNAAFSANLTSHPSGIAYGEEGFKFVMRTGKGNTLSPAMPWISFKNLNDDDLKAIYAYLRTLPPSPHFVNNQPPFTLCAICGLEHGSGNMNKRENPKGVIMVPELYDQYVGTYQEDVSKSTYIVSRKGSNLIVKNWNKGPEFELIPQSELYFIGAGLPLPLTFVKDKNGHITQIMEATDYGRVFFKMKSPSTF
jgi:mono/diheme cytochrome c family protein